LATSSLWCSAGKNPSIQQNCYQVYGTYLKKLPCLLQENEHFVVNGDDVVYLWPGATDYDPDDPDDQEAVYRCVVVSEIAHCASETLNR
jgi:hypothetical protein